MKKLYWTDESGERHMITVASAATAETAHETITAETRGNCIGPADADDLSAELEYLKSHWSELEEMTRAEADERINHLSDEWDLPAEELEYLK